MSISDNAIRAKIQEVVDEEQFLMRLQKHEDVGTFGTIKSPKAAFTGYGGQGAYRTLFAWTFNGEKNLGEMGPIKDYRLDYASLALRSWQAYLESELASTILNKFTKWNIGKGLKIQAEPVTDVLDQEGITLDLNTFSEITELRFGLFAKSRYSDYAGMSSLNKMQMVAHKNAKIGGDVLVILRYINGCIKVQLIDGAHVVNPLNVPNQLNTSGFMEITLPNGNRIENGIELSPTNEHVAYYVLKGGQSGLALETARVPARGANTDLVIAYLVYGSEYRIDNMRGMPLIAGVLETLKKLERYKEATVGSAEELAKVSYQIVHQQFSTGESPLLNNIAKAHDWDNASDLPVDVDGRELQSVVASSTEKQTFNNPIGAEIKTINPNKYQLYFKDFYGVNSDLICAAVGIPPDVAMSKYNSNYSASRAAIKDWEHTLNVERDDFARQFLKPIYELWLYTEVLKNKITAPGFMKAIMAGDYMTIEAYTNARWVGAAVPHIDPLKEVQAERAKLGATAINIPLTTVEQAVEALNSGESDANMQQYADELASNKKLGIEPPPPVVNAPAKKPAA